MSSDARERMVRAAAELFAERGYAATAFSDVIARSGAPRGSIYHHFPQGKEQLAEEALRWYAGSIAAGLARAVERGTSIDLVAGLVARMRQMARGSQFRAGCAVAGVSLDLTGQDEALLGTVADAFAQWQRLVSEMLRRDGVDADRARRVATLVIAAVEGALMMARAEGDERPLLDVAAELGVHVAAAVRAGDAR